MVHNTCDPVGKYSSHHKQIDARYDLWVSSGREKCVGRRNAKQSHFGQDTGWVIITECLNRIVVL